MRKAKIYVQGKEAGILTEHEFGKKYSFEYFENYTDIPISLTLPTEQKIYQFDGFPSFFDGLLPEGYQLEGLLKNKKIDKNDFYSQLITVGEDLIGAVTVKEIV